jgi:predicted MFS family arabinose efflux permease
MAIAWPLAGAVADAFGLRGAFLMYALVTLAVGVGALCLWDRARRTDAAGMRISGAVLEMSSTNPAP